jgi:hypothetical protein
MTDGQKGEKELYLINDGGKTPVPLEPHIIKLDKDTTVIEVAKDGARFLENNCTNQICVHEGWITKCGQTAVCVPKKMALVIECREAEYDAVSQ